ncbi:MAG: hypothetical protein DSM106950_37270 [Stigonema ocellatum SAG 48.90 = DSM 106950]|nr:hypothetical protein [Stigonema ocellatum SAG 48.90 = DSM 106950]
MEVMGDCGLEGVRMGCGDAPIRRCAIAINEDWVVVWRSLFPMKIGYGDRSMMRIGLWGAFFVQVRECIAPLNEDWVWRSLFRMKIGLWDAIALYNQDWVVVAFVIVSQSY